MQHAGIELGPHRLTSTLEVRILVRMVDHSEDDFTGEAADLVLGSKKVEARASALEEDNYRVHAM